MVVAHYVADKFLGAWAELVTVSRQAEETIGSAGEPMMVSECTVGHRVGGHTWGIKILQ